MASKRAVRRRACGTKQRFATVQAAHAAVRSLKIRQPHKAHGLHPYACPFCHSYHFGHGQRRPGETV